MDALAIFLRFQDACPDHVQVQGSSCYFPRELVSFVSLKVLNSFEARKVMRRPRENCISVMRYDEQLFYEGTLEMK